MKMVRETRIPDVVDEMPIGPAMARTAPVPKSVNEEKLLRLTMTRTGMGRAPKFPSMMLGNDKKLKTAG